MYLSKQITMHVQLYLKNNVSVHCTL